MEEKGSPTRADTVFAVYFKRMLYAPQKALQPLGAGTFFPLQKKRTRPEMRRAQRMFEPFAA